MYVLSSFIRTQGCGNGGRYSVNTDRRGENRGRTSGLEKTSCSVYRVKFHASRFWSSGADRSIEPRSVRIHVYMQMTIHNNINIYAGLTYTPCGTVDPDPKRQPYAYGHNMHIWGIPPFKNLPRIRTQQMSCNLNSFQKLWPVQLEVGATSLLSLFPKIRQHYKAF